MLLMLSASFLNDVISKKTLRIFIKIVYDLSNWLHHYYYILYIKTLDSKYPLSCLPLYWKFFVRNILMSQSGNSFYLIWFDCFVSLLWKLKPYSLKKIIIQSILRLDILLFEVINIFVRRNQQQLQRIGEVSLL